MKDYYTFVWCPVPEGGPTGVPLHSSVQFQGTWCLVGRPKWGLVLSDLINTPPPKRGSSSPPPQI